MHIKKQVDAIEKFDSHKKCLCAFSLHTSSTLFHGLILDSFTVYRELTKIKTDKKHQEQSQQHLLGKRNVNIICKLSNTFSTKIYIAGLNDKCFLTLLLTLALETSS